MVVSISVFALEARAVPHGFRSGNVCVYREREREKTPCPCFRFLQDIDTIDIQTRQETLKIRGEPQLLQLPLIPSYALTIHKTQALEGGMRYNEIAVMVAVA